MAVLANPARLRALDATGLLDDASNEVLEQITARVRARLGVPVSLVTLVTDDRQVIQGQRGLPEPWRSIGATPLSHSFCKFVVARAGEFKIEDARRSPLVCDNGAVTDLDVTAYLGTPLRAPGGHVLGALCAIDTAPRTWSSADAEGLRELADVAEAEVAARSPDRWPPGVARDTQGREAALFRALFARMPAPAYVVDVRGVVLRANPSALGGQPRRDVVGRPLAAVAPDAVVDLWEVAGTDVSLALGCPPGPA